MSMKHWQIKTTDTRTGNTLCTYGFPRWTGCIMPVVEYDFQTAYFPQDGWSEDHRSYATKAEAEAGHAELVKVVFGEDADLETVVKLDDTEDSEDRLRKLFYGTACDKE